MSITGFTEFNIPKNVKSISSRALASCSKLEKVRVYSKDISYSSGVFEYGNSNLVLYGYEGSTTQTYAQQNGIEFKTLSNSEDLPTTIGAIQLNKHELSLEENTSETLTVSFIEMPSSTKIIWSSSDENVATVENGKIIAKAIGSAIITVSNVDGTKKATCNVTVKDSSSGTSLDNTIAKGKLPYAGVNITLIIISILTITLIVIITYKKYNNYKDVK